MALLYLDSSAIVKLVVKERESRALFELLVDWPERVSSALARTEVVRAVGRAGSPAEARRAEALLSRIVLIRVDDAVLRVAARLAPKALRTLDAIHVATALSLGEDLGALVSYDAPMLAACALARITTLRPA